MRPHASVCTHILYLHRQSTTLMSQYTFNLPYICISCVVYEPLIFRLAAVRDIIDLSSAQLWKQKGLNAFYIIYSSCSASSMMGQNASVVLKHIITHVFVSLSALPLYLSPRRHFFQFRNIKLQICEGTHLLRKVHHEHVEMFYLTGP